MAKFRFRLVETYSKEVEIEADTKDEAFDILDMKCSEGEINATDMDGEYQPGYEREIFDA